MAWQESDRVVIRSFLGYSDLFLQADSRLEYAMTNLQAIADGGTRPNPSPSAAEAYIRTIIAQLQTTDQNLVNLGQFAGATETDGEAKVDAAREDARLRALGRMFVHRLARCFDTLPISDIYSTAPEGDEWRRRAAYAPFPFGGRTGY